MAIPCQTHGANNLFRHQGNADQRGIVPPDVAAGGWAGAGAAGAGAGASPGLSQQTWTRPFRLSWALGSIGPCRTRQRKEAWICEFGQPKRSERARGRKTVAGSPRHIRLTTRRPSQTHSGLPAGPVSRRAASAISSMLFWPSLALSPAGFCCSGGCRLPLWANAAVAAKLKAATQNAARNTRNKDTNGIVPPVLMEAARPISSLLCDRIGTRLRRFLPAAPALLVSKTRTLEPKPPWSEFPSRTCCSRLGPNG